VGSKEKRLKRMQVRFQGEGRKLREFKPYDLNFFSESIHQAF
jgi:hypothetical protein